MLTSPDPRSASDALGTAEAELRVWRAAHPHATFYDIEVETERQLARVRAALVSELVQDGADEVARPACPTCGEPMQQVGQQERTVSLAYDEPVTVRGPRYRCLACGAGIFPPG